jgi:hypothetical protein
MQIETNQRFAVQFPRNLAANIAYFLVNIVIGVLLVPYFIDTLGVAAYGLIPLATSITGYVAHRLCGDRRPVAQHRRLPVPYRRPSVGKLCRRKLDSSSLPSSNHW